MSQEYPPARDALPAPWFALAAVLLVLAVGLCVESRPWWCACGEAYPISLDPFGRHNSQHVVDPYSLTHVLKGLLFCGLLAWVWPTLPRA